jgi:hypothetical protein
MVKLPARDLKNTNMKRLCSIVLLSCLVQTAVAQFAPQAGVAGSTAIHKTSGLFSGWATGCMVARGYLDINDKQQGLVTSGTDAMGTGEANNTLVSLGDSGMAVLTFSHPIYDGAGPDFAVFENGFPDPSNPEMAFLELAFVEVSSDGVNYFRFAPTCNIPTSPQIPMAGVYADARRINNLAGKYIGSYGTPFDLSELGGKPGLDVNKITHVRIVDVVGTIGSGGSTDIDGNIINDPYPTAIPTGGFDLDAVGALHQEGLFPVAINDVNQQLISVYPNPATENIVVTTKVSGKFNAMLTDVAGRQLQLFTVNQSVPVSISQYNPGIYYLILSDTKGNKWVERLTKL